MEVVVEYDPHTSHFVIMPGLDVGLPESVWALPLQIEENGTIS